MLVSRRKINLMYDWIIKNIDSNGVIVEAGVYDGQDTDFFCRHSSQGKVYGFEPIPSIFREAKQRVGHYPNLVLYQKGLGEKTEIKTMFLSERFGLECGSSSVLKPKLHLEVHPDVTFNRSIEVQTIKLDDWASENQIEKIDLLWLDTQGSEPLILAASPRSLKNTRYLYTEVSLIETYEGVVTYPKFKKFLENNDFEVIHEDFPWKDMGNILCRNKNAR